MIAGPRVFHNASIYSTCLCHLGITSDNIFAYQLIRIRYYEYLEYVIVTWKYGENNISRNMHEISLH